MKKIFLLLIAALSVNPYLSSAQRCGTDEYKASLVRKDPSWGLKFKHQKESLQGIADNYRSQHAGAAARGTTTASPIPVIFHIIVTDSQLAVMGGWDGLQARCDSQIAVLNQDFNAENPDSVLIPSCWKPLFGSTGIRFALAHTSPFGFNTLGYDVKIIPESMGGFTSGTNAYGAAKFDTSGGLDSWDATKYLNIWCFQPIDNTGLLGLTMAKSTTTAETINEEGVCLHFLALGKQNAAGTLVFHKDGNYTLGRTLTHEMGHFFEIWHTWGDDGNRCPWDGGNDDGFADTPPQANHTNGNPTYTIPCGTIYDRCKDTFTVDSLLVMMQPIGTACLDYLDYTDDNGMHLFTPMQAAAMASQVSPTGENYSLTQHPELLEWPPNTGSANFGLIKNFNLFPNPSRGIINITFDHTSSELKQIMITDVLGRDIMQFDTFIPQKNYYSINLTTCSKGIYIVKCTFASGSITRKILLQ